MTVRAVGALHGDVLWVNSTVISNPVDGQIIVDTNRLNVNVAVAGQLVAAGVGWLFGVTGEADASWVYDIQLLDTTFTLRNFVRRRPAAGNDDWLAPNKAAIFHGDRLRVVCVGGATVNAQLSIFAMEMGQ